MSYVTAAPQLVDAAAKDLAAIGSALGAAHVAAATPTRALLPAAADEVSAGIAQFFSQHADDYQKLAGQAASFHGQFIQQLTASANAYAGAEAANLALLRPAAASAASAANAAATGIPWYDQLNIAIDNYIQSVLNGIGFLFFLPFYFPFALSFLPIYVILSAFFPEAFPIDAYFPWFFNLFFG
jgi:PE family